MPSTREIDVAIGAEPQNQPSCNFLSLQSIPPFSGFFILGRIQDAIKQYERAAQVNPSYKLATDNLAVAYTDMGLKKREEGSLSVAFAASLHHRVFHSFFLCLAV